MLAIFLFVGLIAIAVSVVFWTMAKFKKQGPYDSWGGGIAVGIFAVVGCLLAFALTLGDQYQSSIHMPLRLESLRVTITEQTELLADAATLGQGLEGLEIKREIQQTIRDKNELIAEIGLRRLSMWYLFKPRMTTGI